MSTTIKPRSEAQLAASRSNGAKSLGPTTPEGKSKVSKNRMTHGFRSNSIPLSNEDPSAYDTHLAAYLARYNPIDQVEEDLVGLLASNMWLVMRNNCIEVALFELLMTDNEESVNRYYEGVDEYGRIALAFKRSAGDNAFELIRRYKATTERAYHRALQALEKIRKDRKSTVQTQAPHPAPPPSLDATPAEKLDNGGEPAAEAAATEAEGVPSSPRRLPAREERVPER
jgi:hypothetical protein